MDDEVVQRVFQEGERDYFQQQPPSSSASSSILQSLPLHVSFDHGYYLLVMSIQELREKKESPVTVGIGGSSGSGKTREGDAGKLNKTHNRAESLQLDGTSGYTSGAGTPQGRIAIHSLVTSPGHPQDFSQGRDTSNTVYDFQQKGSIPSKRVETAPIGMVIVDGLYALHARLRSLLDIRVAVVQYDIGDPCSLNHLIDNVFPLFRKHIEPDLHHAQDMTPLEGVIEDMQSRIKRLERWHAINTVLWTFLMSALIGLLLIPKKASMIS